MKLLPRLSFSSKDDDLAHRSGSFCSQSRLREGIFKGDEGREWQVMNRAGEAIAESIRFDLGDFKNPERGGAPACSCG